MKKADVGVAAYIVAAFVMLIVPIPSWLLDVLLACNIAIAFTILFTTMFSKELFIFLIWRCLITANSAPDIPGALLTMGVTAHLGLQMLINIAVVTNSIPNTGIPLPFISYGGSSILSTIIVFAVIQGLYLLKQKEVKEIEEKRRESEQRQWNDQTRV